MLDNPYTYIGAIVVICAAWIIYLARTAPLGHQNETGYHDGADK